MKILENWKMALRKKPKVFGNEIIRKDKKCSNLHLEINISLMMANMISSLDVTLKMCKLKFKIFKLIIGNSPIGWFSFLSC